MARLLRILALAGLEAAVVSLPLLALTPAALPWGLLLSTVIVALLVFTGWKGGDLVYEHRVGMHPEEPAEPSASTSVHPDRELHA